MRRWMRMDCHDRCLKEEYEWPGSSPFLKPRATAHVTAVGFQPHALSILAANTYRFNVGKLGMVRGPTFLEEVKNVVLDSCPAVIALAIRIQSWEFVTDRNALYYGPIANNFQQYEKFEQEEYKIILAEKARRSAQKALEKNNKCDQGRQK